MRNSSFVATAAVLTALLAPALIVPATAQVSGTTGRVAKFTSPSAVGDSVMFQTPGGNIGVGTTTPTSKVDINAANALAMRGAAPFMTFFDSSKADQRAVIQSIGGGLTLYGDGVFKGTNPNGFVFMGPTGKVGLGTTAPQRMLQFGPSNDAMFTIEGTNGSPHAGWIRFGDNTGWVLHIGRSKEVSGGSVNSNIVGSLFEFRDDGALRIAAFPYGSVGTQSLCRTAYPTTPKNNYITTCQGSSLRYKASIAPYAGGLDVVEKLKPIAFTRKHNGAHEVGFGAEDIAAVEPRLAYNNDDGAIEGVHYELLTTVLVNAVKQQQEEIKQQRTLIEDLQSRLARLEQSGAGSSGR